jgi:hypothetical protein
MGIPRNAPVFSNRSESDSEGGTARSDADSPAAGMDLCGTIVSLDGVYDCRANRQAIFNFCMVPNINQAE